MQDARHYHGTTQETSVRRPAANGSPTPAAEVARERLLLQRFHDTRDPRLQSELVARFLPLALSLARRYRGAPEPMEDLEQVANLALVKALQRFDPGRGSSFAAFATPTILGDLRNHFRDRALDVHTPRILQERGFAIDEAVEKLTAEHGHSPDCGELALALDLSEEEVLEGLGAMDARRPLSLDVPSSQSRDAATLADSFGSDDPRFETVDVQLAAGTAALTKQERRVLRLRFEDELLQREIAERVGVSQMQVSRLIRRALNKLLAAVQSEPVRQTR